MKRNLLDIICCPDCHGVISLKNAITNEYEIVSGVLFCQRCDVQYPILDGLPVFIKDIGKMGRTKKSFGKQWVWQNKKLFERDTIYGLNEIEEIQDFENIFNLKLNNLANKIILDAGCGSGRLTTNIGKIAKNSTIIGVDIGEGARVAYKNSKELENVHIIQCNLLKLPFKYTLFDYIWSEGVIHHTPNSYQTFKTLDNLLVEGGKMYVWLYPKYKFSPYRLARDLLWKPYILPLPILYVLSWSFAIPLYVGVVLVKGKRHRQNLMSTVFAFFDNLSPEFQQRHTKEEVLNWFSLHNYNEVKIISDLGVVGQKDN